MGMKFSMQGTALADHAKKIDASSSDLGAMVMAFVQSAEPVAKSMNGPVKASFNSFKQSANAVAAMLNTSFQGILGLTNEQDKAFQQHSEQATEAFSSSQAGANFDAAVTRNV